MPRLSRLLIFSAFFLSIPATRSQNAEMIRKARANVASNVDTMMLKGYLDLGLSFLYTDKDSSLFYLEKTADLAKQLKVKRYQANAIITMGNVYLIYRNDNLSKRYFFEGMQLLDPEKDFLYFAMAYGGLSSVYVRDGL